MSRRCFALLSAVLQLAFPRRLWKRQSCTSWSKALAVVMVLSVPENNEALEVRARWMGFTAVVCVGVVEAPLGRSARRAAGQSCRGHARVWHGASVRGKTLGSIRLGMNPLGHEGCDVGGMCSHVSCCGIGDPLCDPLSCSLHGDRASPLSERGQADWSHKSRWKPVSSDAIDLLKRLLTKDLSGCAGSPRFDGATHRIGPDGTGFGWRTSLGRRGLRSRRSVRRGNERSPPSSVLLGQVETEQVPLTGSASQLPLASL